MEASHEAVPRLLRVREAAELTGIERWRLYSLLAEGNGPPHMRVGRTIRISAVALIAWIERQHETGNQKG
jgi:excisionase family DNA binding protein